MRNAVQRRNHKERAQPVEREKWGVLEKHKVGELVVSYRDRLLTVSQDYSLRAKDYNEKKARLSILRQKAAERNPDEFHYGMLNNRSNKGRKLADRGNRPLSQDVVKLLKTQDASYLQTMIQQTRRSAQRLEQKYILEDGKRVDVVGESQPVGNRQHIVFVDDEERRKSYDPHTTLQCDMSNETILKIGDGDEADNSISDDQLNRRSSCCRDEEALQTRAKSVLHKQSRKEQAAHKTKLASLKARERILRDAEKEMDHTRAQMSNSVGGLTKKGVKWKNRERKS